MIIIGIAPTGMIECNDDTDYVAYCSRCLALDIRVDGNLHYCPHCFRRKNPSTIDFTTFERWEELYIQKYGHPLVQKRSIYDDIKDTYEDDAEQILTAYEAIENGLVVREKINLNIEKLK